MSTSSSRLRIGAAIASTGLALVFSFGGQAFAEKPEGGANGSGRPVNTTPNDHPSGNDKTEEPGGSTTQGKSPSDPDGDFNNGADKPGGDGGFADETGEFDRDGNNGCGNDDDFEDDNKGNCGGPEKVKTDDDVKDDDVVKDDDDVKKDDDVVKDIVKTEGTTTVVKNTDSGAVLSSQLENAQVAPLVPEAASTVRDTEVQGVSIVRDTTPAAAPASVLGATFTRDAPLARTGFGLTSVAIAGLLLVLMGFGLKRSTRSSI